MQATYPLYMPPPASAVAPQQRTGNAVNAPSPSAVPCYVFFPEYSAGSFVSSSNRVVWTHLDPHGAPVPATSQSLYSIFATPPGLQSQPPLPLLPLRQQSDSNSIAVAMAKAMESTLALGVPKTNVKRAKQPRLRPPQSPLSIRSSRSSRVPRLPRAPETLRRPVKATLKPMVPALGEPEPVKLNLGEPAVSLSAPSSASLPASLPASMPLPSPRRPPTYREVWRIVDPMVLPPLDPVFAMHDCASSCCPSSDEESDGKEA